ncbi:MAG: hypothetical protein AMXMBFR8_21750 [Nevskiales bacterium]
MTQRIGDSGSSGHANQNQRHRTAMPATPRASRAPAACFIFGLLLAPLAASASYRDDVGYTALQAELGAGNTPDGAGVPVSQIEASMPVGGQDTWMPDPSHAEFVGKTITNASVPPAPAGVYSSHATDVGRRYYGNTTSLAGGITSIAVYYADAWLGSDLLKTSGSVRPGYSTTRIGNHSWVGDANDADINTEVLRRLDWVIETDDFIQAVAMSNGAAPSSVALLASGFNSLTVGRSDLEHGSGSVAVDATYGSGRVRPHVVLPLTVTSATTPLAASMIAMLVELGHGNAALSTDPAVKSFTNRAGLLIRNAERAEVIKAALMAGADRVTHNTSMADLPPFRDSIGTQSANGLDTRYGAGQANIRNSYWIIAAGEKNSTEDGGAGVGSAERGFDYDPAFGGGSGSNSTANYPMPVSATPRLLTATLAWNIDINGGTQSNFNSTATLRDLALAVVNTANSTTVTSSQGTNDNTENIYVAVPANAQYTLRVTRGSGSSFSYDYGLAWQLLPDADGDGAHDDQDNCINVANGPLIPDGGGNSQRDTDGDGFGNVCDGDFDNSGGIVNYADLAQFRGAFGSANADADMDGSGGIVNYTDLALFRNRFGKAPGPSAFAP